MILLLDTSSATCYLTIVTGGTRHDSQWEAGRQLAHGLLGFIETELSGVGKSFSDIKGIGAFKGPGSFTGLRIGLTVLNTLADSLSVPIVGEIGDDWQDGSVARLEQGQNEQIVMPSYGGHANITSPRK